jgi:flavin-dependent dehydrogenase
MPAPRPAPELVETCDVCIVGAGLAGLNALFVASQYLSRDQKVILVDRRRRRLRSFPSYSTTSA